MRLGQSRLQQVVSYGLSESEARVYLALLDHPALGASALAKTTGVPRTHLYEILESLQGLGLIDIHLVGATRSYRPRPLHEYLERRIRDQRAHVQEMETRLEDVRAMFVPAPEPATQEDPGALRVLLGRRAVAREIDRLITEARESVAILSSNRGTVRVLRHLEAAGVADDGPRYEVYLPRAARVGGTHDRLPPRILEAIRWHDLEMPMLAVVRDGREALWIHPFPDDGQLRAGKDTDILTSNTAFVDGYLALLRAATGGPAK